MSSSDFEPNDFQPRQRAFDIDFGDSVIAPLSFEYRAARLLEGVIVIDDYDHQLPTDAN